MNYLAAQRTVWNDLSDKIKYCLNKLCDNIKPFPISDPRGLQCRPTFEERYIENSKNLKN